MVYCTYNRFYFLLSCSLRLAHIHHCKILLNWRSIIPGIFLYKYHALRWQIQFHFLPPSHGRHLQCFHIVNKSSSHYTSDFSSNIFPHNFDVIYPNQCRHHLSHIDQSHIFNRTFHKDVCTDHCMFSSIFYFHQNLLPLDISLPTGSVKVYIFLYMEGP